MEDTSKFIGCIVVTFNRLSKLRKALEAYDAQTLKPSYVMVVDNHSMDGTADYLRGWGGQKSPYRRIVVTMPENLGGAGGFARGFEEVFKLDAEWIWVADDDAYPEKDAIQVLDEYIRNLKSEDDVMSVCAAVMEHGKYSLDHRRRMWQSGLQVKREAISEASYRNKAFELKTFSYVGAVISKRALREAGLPRADYFIHYDDTEHSLRISKCGKIVCVPKAKVIHESPTDGRDSDMPDWRFYYNNRNYYDLEKNHFPVVWQYQRIRDRLDACFHILTGRKKMKYKMILEALRDAEKGKMGKHPIYQPGWNPEFKI